MIPLHERWLVYGYSETASLACFLFVEGTSPELLFCTIAGPFSLSWT